MVYILPLSTGGVPPMADGVRDIGLVFGKGNGANNASSINSKLDSRLIKYPIQLEGGALSVVESIGAAVDKTGWSIIGSGTGGDATLGPESTWTGGGSTKGGRQTTRIVWDREDNTTTPDQRSIFKIEERGILLDKLDLRGTYRYAGQGSGNRYLAKLGEPTTWSSQNYAVNSFVTHLGEIWRASSSQAPTSSDVPGTSSKWFRTGYQAHVGVWMPSGSGAEINGPLIIPSMTIGDVDVGFLLGKHSNFPATDTQIGHADTLLVDLLQLSGVPVGVWFRTEQSVSNMFGQVYARIAPIDSWNDPLLGYNAVFWMEYGGSFTAQAVEVGEYRTLLYVGRTPHVQPTSINHFRVDGGVTHFRLFKAEHTASASGGNDSAQWTIQNGNISTSWHNSVDAQGEAVEDDDPNVSGIEPIVDAGVGKLIIREVTGIRPDSIKMTGRTTGGGDKQPCIVQFENCTFHQDVQWPGNVGSTGLIRSGSVTYIMRWRDCNRRNSSGSYRIETFDDGEARTADLASATISAP